MVNLTFDIENRGTEPLEVYGLNIAGADAAEFSIISPAVPFTVSLSGSQTVTVQFDGVSVGTKEAKLLITSNDVDESTCEINLTGVGTNDVPDLVVKHDNIIQECGTGVITSTTPYTTSTQFDIVLENAGTTDLTINNILLANGTQFSIFASPTLPFDIAVGQTTNITLEFNPANIASYTDSILFSTNDPDNSSCIIDLLGQSTDPATDAEIEVLSGVNTLVCGTSEVTVFSDQNLVGTTTITISNTGTEDLIVSGAVLQGADAAFFTMTSPLANEFPFAIPPNNTADLDIEIDFAPVSAGNRIADLIITSNDNDEDPCVIKIKGNVTDDPNVPEIVIIDENNLVQECGYKLDFGDIAALDSSNKTIFVENIGASDLTITSLAISGVAANAYTILAPTAFPIVLTPNSRQQIDLEFSGSVVGIYDAVLTVNNSDTDESACIVNLQGSVATPRDPDIQLEDDSPTDQACGVILDFGSINLGDSNPTVTYKIKNLGLAILEIRSLNFSGVDAGAFSLVSPPTTPLAIAELSGEQDIEIQYDPTAVGFGVHNAILHINNNDGADDPCNIVLTGEYIDTSIGDPEIQIFDLSNTELQCGDTYDMGNTPKNVRKDDRLIITNSGASDLIFTNIFASGDVGSLQGIQAYVTDVLPIIVPPNSSVYLHLELFGSIAATQNITVTLESNEPDENPCILNITGEIGGVTGTPDIQVENDIRDQVYPCGSTITMSPVAEGTNANVNESIFIVNTGTGALVFDQEPYFTGGASASFTFEWVTQGDPDSEAVIKFNPSGAASGTYSAVLNLETNDPDEDPCLITFEIVVEGVSVAILDENKVPVNCEEQATPVFTLDLGTISLSNSNTKTYYIKNTGTLPVTVNSIGFVNSPTEFTLSPIVPPSVTLQPDEELSASVSLIPTTIGIKTNQIRITTTDPDLSICTINVEAEVLDLPVQDLEVRNSNVVIDCNGVIDFGEVELTATGRQVIELVNVGGSLLTVASLAVSGGDATLFDIPVNPTPVVIPAGSQEAVSIVFDPSGNIVGQYSTTLIISSDDSDENPCNITLIAQVVDNTPNPEFPATCGSSLPTNAILLTPTDPVQVDTYTFTNLGNGDWIIDAIIITGDPEYTFSFNPSTFPATIGTNASLEVTATFDTPNAALGPFNGIFTIISNAVNNESCFYSVEHIKYDPNLQPELDLEVNNVAVECGASVVFPAITADQSNPTYPFTILNSGTFPLTVTSIEIIPDTFISLDNGALPLQIAEGSQEDLTLTIDHGGIAGTYQANIIINTNDDDESSCLVAVSQVVDVAAEPELEIQDENDDVIACGDTIDFGTFEVGAESQPSTQVLKLFNTGDAPLDITGIVLAGANVAQFGITNLTPPVTINVGNNAIPILSFDAHTSSVGTYTATIEIQSNDSDEGSCTFTLTAEVIQPNDADLSLVVDAVTLDTPVNCGDFIVMDAAFDDDPIQAKLLGIENAGTTNLVISDVTLTGANASDFTLSSLGTPVTILPAQSQVVQSLTIDPTVVGAGTYTCTVTYISNDPVNPNCALDFTITIGTPVVQDVQLYDENTNLVNCGSYTLDFGTIDLNATSTQTIRVENAGTENLTISDIDVLVLSGGLFVETEGAQVLAAGEFIDMDITFDPTAIGTSTAQLRVFSDDPDEATCTMNLQGTATSAPELQLQDLNGMDVDCGTFNIDLGITEVGTSTSTSFVIQNVGSSDLTVTNITTTNAEFTVSPNSFPVVISAGGLQSVVVTYDPVATGTDADTLTITSDDSDESTCSILLNGEGIVTAVPDIFIKDGVTGYACGALTKDIGQVEQGASAQTTFTIENVGTGNLNVTNIASSNGDFTVAPTLFSVAPSGTQLITVTYTPTSIGTESSIITITSDDADEGSCAVNIDAEGVAATPDIQLQDNDTAQNIPCGSGSHTFPLTQVGNSDQYILEIDNDGLGTLNISSITSDNPAFTVSPTSMVIASNNEQDLTITWTPTVQGAQSATISINSDDPDENPCTFSVDGTASGVPELQLLNMSNSDVACGAHTLTWTGLSSGDTSNEQFQIKNVGSSNLSVSNISTSDNSWSVDILNVDLAPTATQIITVTYTATNTGTYNGTLEIFSNDSDENPCIVNLSATVEGPEIQLQDNITTQNYDCGAETFDLGIVGIGNSNTFVLEIDNDGQDPLIISSITSSGSGDFTVSPSNLTISAGGEQDITVTFTPTSLGTKNATFTINSNDYDEPTCSFGVTGIGSGAAELQLEDQNGSDISCGVGTVVNFGNITNGSTTTVNMGIENIGNANLIVTDITITGTNASAFDLLGGTSYTLGSGSTQGISIDLTPEFVGTHTAILTVSSNDSDESTCQVTLEFGVAADPELQLVNSSSGNENCGATLFDFTDTLADQTDSGTFSIRNEGTTPLTITSINSGDSTVTISGSFPITISPSALETFTVTYAPQAAGTNSTTVTIVNDDADEGNCTFQVVATSITPLIQVRDESNNIVACSDTIHDFGDVITLSTDTTTVTVENIGTAPLTLTNVFTSTGSVTTNPSNEPIVIPVGGVLPVDITYAPVNAGATSAFVGFYNDSLNNSTCAVQVLGNSINADLRVQDQQTSNTLDCNNSGIVIGSVPVGSNISRLLIVHNDGNRVLEITNVSTNNPVFEINPSDTTKTVGIGQFEIIEFFVRTSDADNFFGQLTIESNDVFKPTCNINLSVTTTPTDILTLFDLDTSQSVLCGTGTLDFGNRSVGVSLNKNLRIQNLAFGDITYSATITGTDAADFSFSPTGGGSISEISNVDTIVTFNPSSTGTKTATLTLQPTHDLGFPTCSVTITGVGV